MSLIAAVLISLSPVFPSPPPVPIPPGIVGNPPIHTPCVYLGGWKCPPGVVAPAQP